MNDRTRAAVALDVDVAATRADRRRGLLGRDSLAPTEGLMLAPCKAVHTVGMRFPIDVVFIDGDGKAVRVVRDLAPWRIAMSARAKAVIELAAGTAKASDIQLGDMLYLAPAPPPRQRTAPIKPDAQRRPEAARTSNVRRKPETSVKAKAAVEEHPRC
jgi:uncharacterized membrane protein (UPF0127 family)